MTEISVVIPTWNRGPELLRRTLATLLAQTHPPTEVIVADASSNEKIADEIGKLCGEFESELIVHLRKPLSTFSMSRSFNIGIKRTDNCDYILCTGAEMLFGPNYLEELLLTPDDGVVSGAPCGFLPKGARYPDDLVAEWDTLVRQVIPGTAAKISPGTIQYAPREWWFEIHGYDESLPFAYADSDMGRRAIMSGKKRQAPPWKVAQVLHQWHETSELVSKLGGSLNYVIRNENIVRNPAGWGE